MPIKVPSQNPTDHTPRPPDVETKSTGPYYNGPTVNVPYEGIPVPRPEKRPADLFPPPTVIGPPIKEHNVNYVKREPNALIKDFEELRVAPYKDEAGNWTQGWGRKLDLNPKASDFGARHLEHYSINPDIADGWLAEDVRNVETLLHKTVKRLLTNNQKEALTAFIYNIGPNAFKTSTALKHLVAGNNHLVGEAMKMWNKVTIDGQKVVSKGLERRRQAEVDLFYTPD